MDHHVNSHTSITKGTDIINKAQSVDLDPRILYEAVIDLSSEGLITANCINMAAGILLDGLGLPNYFFDNITKESLKNLLASISTSITIKDEKVVLFGRVAHVDFDLKLKNNVQKVRIATEETRDNMEDVLESQISGHRREYYYSPKNKYYTYLIGPETVKDYSGESIKSSQFLFSMENDFATPPEPTYKRYENFLEASQKSVAPLVEVFNLPVTGETRLMFDSDFATPQLPVLRKLMEDHGLVLIRAYWEPYFGKYSVHSSVCSLYIQGELSRKKEHALLSDLESYLAFSVNDITDQYRQGALSFKEMLFAGNAIDFTHMFIFKESENATDRDIIDNLSNKDHKEAFAGRIQSSNKSTYGSSLIWNTVKENPDLVKFLYELFEKRFDPGIEEKMPAEDLEEKLLEFDKLLSSRFIDSRLGYDIFKFMSKFVYCTLKTNFYKDEKRAFSFRLDQRILDPLVFDRFIYGIFFVNGHYACGTHLRADDIARGGLRLIRVSPTNYDTELDNAVLLNYALGPKAQRLKHKDICESGSKGVVVPKPIYVSSGKEALLDYTEGIMDLMQGDRSIVDYFGKPEMVFFGPDEGTAPLMDTVSLNAKARGYRYWRTLTTGKSFGIPHDTFGMLDNDDLFGLFDRGEDGTELQINGETVSVTQDMNSIYDIIGGRIETSGMTTTSVMGAFRALIAKYDAKEEQLNLMITGGPDGDLGSNQIQCYKGNICLVIDGGSILFDPEGLDKKELMKIAFMRNSSPRANSLAFPEDKLSAKGFRVPFKSKGITLPDGTFVEDGAIFHKTFLSTPANRKFVEQANIRAFVPCGGFKDTIHHSNVKDFLELFKELEFIVEGANVFFDDASRRYIASFTKIKQIKDSTANKGGVFSSSISEVLTGFLLQEDYEEKLLNNASTRTLLTRDVMVLVLKYAALETNMLIEIHKKDESVPLFDLSEQTSEEIFALQAIVETELSKILADEDFVWRIMELYIPEVLIKTLGQQGVMKLLNSQELKAYRDAIITKKVSSMAFYKYGLDWDTFLGEVKVDFMASMEKAITA